MTDEKEEEVCPFCGGTHREDTLVEKDGREMYACEDCECFYDCPVSEDQFLSLFSVEEKS